jgi:hypothetical protein
MLYPKKLQISLLVSKDNKTIFVVYILQKTTTTGFEPVRENPT